MPNIDDTVCSRNIQYTVIVQNAHVWKYIAAFGEAFAERDPRTEARIPKVVDGYRGDPTGWHVTVSIPEGDEIRFFEFIRSFSKENRLTFHGP